MKVKPLVHNFCVTCYMQVFRSCLMTHPTYDLPEYDFPNYVTIENGAYGPEDYVLKINGEAISYRSLANICAFLAENEERRFPQSDGFFGKKKLIDCLVDAMEEGQVPDELLVKHQI